MHLVSVMSGRSLKSPTSSTQNVLIFRQRRKTRSTWLWISLLLNGLLLSTIAWLAWQRSRDLPPVVSAPVIVTPPLIDAPPNLINPVSSNPDSTDPELNAGADVQSEAALGTRHYLSYQEWLDILAQEAKAAVEHPSDKLTILAGDSISLWFPTDLLPPDRTWLNQGISGETTVGLLRRLELFADTQPQTIFVMIGINDLLNNISTATVLANQAQIVTELKAQHPQAKIVVQSILPHGGAQSNWEGRDRLLAVSNAEIQALNQQIETLAQSQGVEYLDLYPLFADAHGNLQENLTTDGLHLSRDGYWVWRTALHLYRQQSIQSPQSPAKTDAL